MPQKTYIKPQMKAYSINVTNIIMTSIEIGGDANVDYPALSRPRENSQDNDWSNYTGQ